MNYTAMKEVTKDEFFGIINEGKLDVLVRPETKEPGHWYPHTTEFKFRDGTVFVIVFNGYRKVCTPGRIACVSKPFTSWDDLGTTSDGNIFNDIRMDISGRSSSPEWTLEWQID